MVKAMLCRYDIYYSPPVLASRPARGGASLEPQRPQSPPEADSWAVERTAQEKLSYLVCKQAIADEQAVQ